MLWFYDWFIVGKHQGFFIQILRLWLSPSLTVHWLNYISICLILSTEVVSNVFRLVKAVEYVFKHLAECLYFSTSYGYCLGNLASHRKMPSGHVKLAKCKIKSKYKVNSCFLVWEEAHMFRTEQWVKLTSQNLKPTNQSFSVLTP